MTSLTFSSYVESLLINKHIYFFKKYLFAPNGTTWALFQVLKYRVELNNLSLSLATNFQILKYQSKINLLNGIQNLLQYKLDMTTTRRTTFFFFKIHPSVSAIRYIVGNFWTTKDLKATGQFRNLNYFCFCFLSNSLIISIIPNNRIAITSQRRSCKWMTVMANKTKSKKKAWSHCLAFFNKLESVVRYLNFDFQFY